MGPGAARLPPTLGQLSVAALTAATHVLIPVEATIGASRALPQILKTVESIRARGVNPGLEIVGLALVRFESTRHAREWRHFLAGVSALTCGTGSSWTPTHKNGMAP